MFVEQISVKNSTAGVSRALGQFYKELEQFGFHPCDMESVWLQASSHAELGAALATPLTKFLSFSKANHTLIVAYPSDKNPSKLADVRILAVEKNPVTSAIAGFTQMTLENLPNLQNLPSFRDNSDLDVTSERITAILSLQKPSLRPIATLAAYERGLLILQQPT